MILLAFHARIPKTQIFKTNFLLKISQFQFLVTTEESVLVYKLFFVIKHSRF